MRGAESDVWYLSTQTLFDLTFSAVLPLVLLSQNLMHRVHSHAAQSFLANTQIRTKRNITVEPDPNPTELVHQKPVPATPDGTALRCSASWVFRSLPAASDSGKTSSIACGGGSAPTDARVALLSLCLFLVRN